METSDTTAAAASLANRTVMDALTASDPVLVDVQPAAAVMPVFSDDGSVLLHAGPPIALEDALEIPPLRGAAIGALVSARRADDPGGALNLLRGGDVRLEPTHDHRAAGPMAGIVSADMPVFVVEDATGRGRAFVTINEGLGRTLRFGAFDEPVLARLAWMRDVLQPILRDALAAYGPLPLRPVVREALSRGDECHNRNKAATALVVQRLGPSIVRVAPDAATAASCLEFIGGNDHFFLNLSIAQSKATTLAAPAVAGSSVVTVLSCNGKEVGVQVAGAPGTWFTAPSPRVTRGRWLADFGPEDGAPLLGDSFVSEVNGLGAFAAAAAPAITAYVGGTVGELIAANQRMYDITLDEHPVFRLPFLDFRGSPFGIDVHAVTATGIQPVVNAGVAGLQDGVGQVGAGLTAMPLQPFARASRALAPELLSQASGDASP